MDLLDASERLYFFISEMPQWQLWLAMVVVGAVVAWIRGKRTAVTTKVAEDTGKSKGGSSREAVAAKNNGLTAKDAEDAKGTGGGEETRRHGGDLISRFGRVLDRITRRRVASVLGIFVLALALRLGTLPWNPVPLPAIHDEFSYLLGGETFAHGRITNPTPPHWISFETFHVNFTPTYQTMYPPAQPLFLAFGMVVFGVAWGGVLFGVAAMCAACYWAALGFAPGRYALIASLALVLRFAVGHYWVNTYWGGGVAGLGGALMLGASVRMLRRARTSDALLFAFGLLLLANSRPYEGLLASLVPLGMALRRVWERRAHREVWMRTVLPTVAMLAVGFSAMLYYNHRSTGDALVQPYKLSLDRNHITFPLLGPTRRPIPQYHHAHMAAQFIQWEYARYMELLQPHGLERQTREKLAMIFGAFFTPFGLPALVAFLLMWTARKQALAAGVLLMLLLGILAMAWPSFVHYEAPGVAAMTVLVAYILRRMRRVSLRGFALGRGLMPVTAAFLVGFAALTAFLGVADRWQVRDAYQFYNEIMPSIERARMVRMLEQRPEKSLVFVRYPTQPIVLEWVYNHYDLPASKVAWAQYVTDDYSLQLRDAYGDRKWYVMDGTAMFPRLREYDPKRPGLPVVEGHW